MLVLAGESFQHKASSKSGPLEVHRKDSLLAMDLPSRPGERVPCPQVLRDAMGVNPSEVYLARDYLTVLNSEEEVMSLAPDLDLFCTLDGLGVIVTAPGKDSDFVSRCFFPKVGIAEDPVTGSAHCTLIPYWSKRTGKKDLFARQLSSRGGELWCRDLGQRVEVAGQCVLYFQGKVFV